MCNRNAGYHHNNVSAEEYHSFSSDNEVALLRKRLLAWYAKAKRPLPWRESVTDVNENAYRVWVSEVMCQQTRVDTVKEYYCRWIEKWPNVFALAAADSDHVREMWSGLGYYSRGERLLQGAQIVVNKFHGIIPSNAETLQKEIPGIGRYTAGAIASIAFNQPSALVDGNVIRVLSRLRALGINSKSKRASDLHWTLAKTILDPTSPGDFNQSLMELGATLCTPSKPQCRACPVKDHCRALEESFNETSKSMVLKRKFIKEASCDLCLTERDIENCAVTRYPATPKKRVVEETEVMVPIVEHKNRGHPPEFMLFRRPPKGILANLWDFPHLPHKTPTDSIGMEIPCLQTSQLVCVCFVGSVKHLLSHQKIIMHIYHFTIAEKPIVSNEVVWWTDDQIQTGAVPMTLKKALKALKTLELREETNSSIIKQPSIAQYLIKQ